ncbi:hypothetical protein PCC9214_03252 [Planktothrix tepida]|uniref:Tetratricopeptide repeat protein n=1 Tax=Planktothrix tepida PCC 9214 TaxID=671072 RepID=A0A1J1LQD9_9CYAN|nr:tetratricopeptide repeat protein [Planktothrix tepida]CAD5962059.1 hypothetical protein PCC9214_03252 [Planktothrix tepida]CUR34800.1 hypothetical protein PL9214650239 [Planktothrix tepida PCC 9214]
MNQSNRKGNIQLANQLQREGKWDEAISLYRQALENNPAFSWYYSQLAEIFKKKGCWEEVIQACNKAIELNPNSAWFYYQLCEVFIKIENSIDAVKAYKAIIQLKHSSISPLNDYYIKYYPNLALSLVQQGLLNPVLDCYDEVLKSEPNSAWIYYDFGLILAERGLMPEAVVCFQRAPQLSEALMSPENLDKVLSAYQIAIQFQQSDTTFDQKYDAKKYSSLALSLVQQGLLDHIINCYDQVFNLEPDSASIYYNLGVILGERKFFKEAVICFHRAPQIKLMMNIQEHSSPILGEHKIKNGEVYSRIWHYLNKKDFNSFYDENCFDHLPLDFCTVSKYFEHQNQLKYMEIKNLSNQNNKENDINRKYLTEVGISLANLMIISQNNATLEEIYINSFTDDFSFNFLRKPEKVSPLVEKSIHYCHHQVIDQQSIIETGYRYCICPMTGAILKSNQSFYMDFFRCNFYRFVGSEVFYIIETDLTGEKKFIYFPKPDLLINLVDPFYYGFWNSKYWNLIRFKSCMVCNWKKVKSYIISDQKKKVVSVLGSYNHLGHHFYQELTAIQYLYDQSILDKVDHFLIGPTEFLKIDEVFPEISGNKIHKIEEGQSIFETILENHYFASRFTQFFVTEKLVSRIVKSSYNYVFQQNPQDISRSLSHIELLNYLRKKRKYSEIQKPEFGEIEKSFPLLWINVRSHNRIWVSQVEGIANIINNLYVEYPQMGVIFSGWSSLERGDSKNETVIQRERALVQNIIDLIPVNLKVYNTIGCSIYESVLWSIATDIYIAPVGGGPLFYMTYIANNPNGVLHYNTTLSHLDDRYWFRENAKPPRVLISQKPYVTNLNSNGVSTLTDYECNWKAIYNEICKIIGDLVSFNNIK